jgi:hypothetical protein
LWWAYLFADMMSAGLMIAGTSNSVLQDIASLIEVGNNQAPGGLRVSSLVVGLV